MRHCSPATPPKIISTFHCPLYFSFCGSENSCRIMAPTPVAFSSPPRGHRKASELRPLFAAVTSPPAAKNLHKPSSNYFHQRTNLWQAPMSTTVITRPRRTNSLLFTVDPVVRLAGFTTVEAVEQPRQFKWNSSAPPLTRNTPCQIAMNCEIP